MLPLLKGADAGFKVLLKTQKKWSCVFVFLKKKKTYISRISSYSDAVRDAITEKPSAGDTLSMVQAMYKETELAFFIYNGCL